MNKLTVLGLVIIVTIILAIIGIISLFRRKTIIVAKKNFYGDCELYVDDKFVGQTIERFGNEGNMATNGYAGTRQAINYAPTNEVIPADYAAPANMPANYAAPAYMPANIMPANMQEKMPANIPANYERKENHIKNANEYIPDYVKINANEIYNNDRNVFKEGYNMDNYINYGTPAQEGIIDLNLAKEMYPNAY